MFFYHLKDKILLFKKYKVQKLQKYLQHKLRNYKTFHASLFGTDCQQIGNGLCGHRQRIYVYIYFLLYM